MTVAATTRAPAPQPARFASVAATRKAGATPRLLCRSARRSGRARRPPAYEEADWLHAAEIVPLGPKSLALVLTLADRDKARHGGAVRLLVEQYSF